MTTEPTMYKPNVGSQDYKEMYDNSNNWNE